ncbi:MAG: hypothetical protein O3A46_13735, partial [Candidatus Poribacteria bacterium]|nr:hypothetical protein [Candidatus Poribacteria bacterium]
IQQRLTTDAALQAQLLNDPEVNSALRTLPAVQAAGTAIATQVATELQNHPDVQAAFITGGQAAAEAKIAELAAPIVEQRLTAALPSLFVTNAAAILPVVAPKILPIVAPDIIPIVAPILLPVIAPEIAPIVAPDLLPLVQDEILAQLGPDLIPALVLPAFNNVLGDPTALVGRLQAELAPFLAKVSNEVSTTGDVPIVSRFNVPEPNGLWIVDIDLSTVNDGEYMVQIDVNGGELGASAKVIRIDRTPGQVTPLEIAANAGTGAYTRASDGAFITTALTNDATIQLKSTVDGDGIGAIFQTLGIEEDSANQARRVWLPVNSSAVLIAAGLRQASGNVSQDEAYDFALLTLVLTDPSLIGMLNTIDPEGIAKFVTGYNTLSAAEKAEVQNTARIVREIVLNGNVGAAAEALNLQFASLQKYAALLADLPTIPVGLRTSASVKMLMPPIGNYYLRAVWADQFVNLGVNEVPKRIEVVSPDPDIFPISALSLGDANGDGATDGPFESVVVGEDGIVSPDDFRVWANTAALDVTFTNSVRTAHPLVNVTAQASTDGATWMDIGTLSAADLAGAAQGSSFTVNYAFDVNAWLDSGVEMLWLRVVSTNALSVIGTSPTVALVVDELPILIEPEVLSLTAVEADGFFVNPDSGGLRGVVNVIAQTGVFTQPTIGSALFEISVDGGANFLPLDGSVGSSGDGTDAELDVVEGERNTGAWMVEWDTSAVADTVENFEPENRDASQDDSPYLVRVTLFGEDGAELVVSAAVNFSVDNIDDVPPITGSTITLVEREAKQRGTYEPAEQNAAGEFVLRANARFTVNIIAPFPTIANGFVQIAALDASGAVIAVVGEVPVVQDQTVYTIIVDTPLVENGVYDIAAVVTDEAGNTELVDPAAIVPVSVENILIGGLPANDPGVLDRIFIIQTGSLSTNRTLRLAPEQRPVSDVVVFEVDAENAQFGGLFWSKNLAEVSDAALELVDVTDTPVSGNTFEFTLDVGAMSDGPIYIRFVFAASPNVITPFEPVTLIVDNTPPTANIVAPLGGITTGTRPILWGRYADTYGIVVGNMTLESPDGVIFDETVGDPDTVIVNEQPIDGLTFTGDSVIYRTPNDARLEPNAYALSISATDLAGNTSDENTANQTSSSFVVEPDTTSPIVSSFAPVGTTTKLRPRVTITFADNRAGVSRGDILIDVVGPTNNLIAG